MDHVTTRSGFTLSFIPCDDQKGGADGRCHGYGEALLAEGIMHEASGPVSVSVSC